MRPHLVLREQASGPLRPDSFRDCCVHDAEGPEKSLGPRNAGGGSRVSENRPSPVLNRNQQLAQGFRTTMWVMRVSASKFVLTWRFVHAGDHSFVFAIVVIAAQRHMLLRMGAMKDSARCDH